ncbi:TetR family transcriptional regulator [Duganella sp. FT80W]|uniref:TetR family transcriptional regulator n=1 Tax=Duganella guangzhouensis TaxID=2666084 RepID=A0A6I2L642_9BURK|nr:TetR/AcrR family transcriptional regulator [Duganella guangzhouensis]MRW93273.1 TetR family transcriptional regulator [Duganella guangzhouensis]
MKKSKAETAETRRRIVEIAAKAFRKQGIEATGVAQIMASAGLSHGGFYRHFTSKDQLVTEALSATEKNLLRDSAAAAETGGDAILRVFNEYMTSNYRDNVEDGCPLAAMGSELVRANDDTRHAATNSFRKITDTVAPFMHARDGEDRDDMAISLLTNMIGALTVARMVDDPVLSDKILAVTQRRIGRVIDHTKAPSARRLNGE